MIDVYKETGEATEELKQRKEELIETYNLEKYGIDGLTSSYEEVAEAMKKARLE
jgi:prefoldin subunit 5